jgi:hypothetical protein
MLGFPRCTVVFLGDATDSKFESSDEARQCASLLRTVTQAVTDCEPSQRELLKSGETDNGGKSKDSDSRNRVVSRLAVLASRGGDVAVAALQLLNELSKLPVPRSVRGEEQDLWLFDSWNSL